MIRGAHTPRVVPLIVPMAAPVLHRIQRFEVIAVLGTGGMGTVYRARDPQLERDVAIKVLAESAAIGLRGDFLDDTIDLRGDAPVACDDLLREARMMAKLSHPNVLPVYEVGLANGSLFVVMEHIAGQDLESWLGIQRTTAEVLQVFVQAGRGLEAAHAHGIVHRDFKPPNVLIGTDGRVRVADFGLSRLTMRTPAAMIRVDDGRGTPRYMAPELWQGAPATPASDVYAYCAAIDRALGSGAVIDDRDRRWRERGLTRSQRELLAAGMSDDPAVRPALPAILAALDGRAPRRRWMIVGAVAAIALGIGVAVATRPASTPNCQIEQPLAGHWDAARREALRSHLLEAAPKGDKQIDRILASLDARGNDIERGMAATCVALGSGDLTEAQAAMRLSCYQRRAYAQGAMVASLLARHDSLGIVESNVEQAVPDCTEIEAPPLSRVRGPAIALWYRMYASRADPPLARAEVLRILERDANALGERQLAAQAAFVRGAMLHANDRLVEADTVLQRAYRGALDDHSRVLQVAILNERSFLAIRRGDAKSARGFSQLARELADRPNMPAAARASVYSALGRSAQLTGDPRAAIEALDKSYEIAHAAHLRTFETTARSLLIQAHGLNWKLNRVPESLAATKKLAAENADAARNTFGPHAEDYAIALTLKASTIEPRDAIPLYREAISVLLEHYPKDHSQVIAVRFALAFALRRVNSLREARVELEQLLATSEHSPTLRPQRPDILSTLGRTLFELGEFDAGLRELQQALEEYERSDPDSLQVRQMQILFELELGRLDDAAHHIDVLEHRYRDDPKTSAKQVAYLHGLFSARLVRQRGNPRRAEKLTRKALATLRELRGDDAFRADLLDALAASLIDQRRWIPARRALLEAYRLAKKLHADAVNLAQYEVELARIDFGRGRRAAARTRARRARKALAHWPSAIVAHRHLAEILDPPRNKRPIRRRKARHRRP